MHRWTIVFLAANLAPGIFAQNTFFGAMGGVSTISADARVVGSPPERTSAYKPENGPTAVLFAGRHFSDYFSIQASYGWNRNAVTLSASDVTTGNSFDLPVRTVFHTFAVEAMAYFRPRASRLRPYLSAGPALVLLHADADGTTHVRGSPILPASRIRATKPGLRVAVGIDWRLATHFALRYSFSETIQPNPLSRSLTPPGERGLANFQNWWGVLWSF